MDAAKQQADINYSIEMVKADSQLRQSALDHDKSLDGGKFINTLRASIRPVITYTFFSLFVGVKVAAAYVMLSSGQSVPEMLNAVWDVETMSLFSTIIAFWFGSRVMEKRDSIPQPQLNVTVTNNKKTTK